MKPRLILALMLLWLAPACSRTQRGSHGDATTAAQRVNTDHLLGSLYQPARMATTGTDVGVVWIYSEPDAAGRFNRVADADEGYTCVDDVARAGLFLLGEPDLAANADKQHKLRQMTRFVLAMQAPNGYFYNFLWPDNTINTTYRTSTATPNWWSWRALWQLSEAYPYFRKTDADLAAQIRAATNRLVAVMVRDFGTKKKDGTPVQGVIVPTWLPYGSGSDQAAVMLLGLGNVYGQTPTAPVLALMEQLAEGILLMQKGNRRHYPYGAFLSFENHWHAYGNDQAYALLTVGTALHKSAWVAAARREVEWFYPFLLKQGFLESFSVGQTGERFTTLSQSSYGQIAYGVRPMIWATLTLYGQTGNPRLLQQAKQLTAWFLGNNPARARMYNAATGRCLDGITSATTVSRNAGAESTIEALLALQRVEGK